MGKVIDFLETWLNPRKNTAEQNLILHSIVCAENEFNLRRLSYRICVNMIANAIGRCEMKVYNRKEEVRDSLYYLWNYSPNVNENSTAFWHHLIERLYADNEALIIETSPRTTRRGTSLPAVVVADEFEQSHVYPTRMNEYENVKAGEVSYNKTFRERDVYHLKLHAERINEVRAGVVDAYNKLASQVAQAYAWSEGHHLKVKIGSVQQGSADFEQKFQQLLNNQVKPFFSSGNTILPEFSGYEWSYFEPQKTAAGSGSSYIQDMKALTEDIWNFTAQAFGIPLVLVQGKVEATKDATSRFLSNVIDPLCDQIGEEITRKEYDLDDWMDGSYVAMDSSTITHFDLFEEAASIEKLIGSGVYSVNDIRRAAGQPRIEEPWADEHYMTLNISPIGEPSD